MSIIFLEDEAMQDKAWTRINDLVKWLRRHPIKNIQDAADALESQSAELTRLRERNAELERKDADWRRVSIKQGNELYAQKVRIASLEARLEAFRMAAKMARDDEKEGTVVFGTGHCVSRRAFDALMSALRMEGEKDVE